MTSNDNTPAARATIVTASSPSRLSKRYSLDGFGKLTKEGAGAMSAGRAEVVEFSTLDGLAEVLTGLGPNQAMAWGLPALAPVRLVTRDAWARAGKPDDCLPRTNDTFAWPSGPGVLMLDHDPPPGGAALSRDDLVATIRAACPGLAGAAMLWWCSASSHITRTDTGEDLTGLRGQRLYIMVADARDVPRAGAALVDHLWAGGHGHIQVSKSGALLERTIIDASVWQPSRLDFAAGAVCVAPLRQERGAPVVIDGAVFIDTTEAIPSPDTDTRRAAERARADAKRAAKPEADAAQEAWVDDRVEDMVEPSATAEQREAARKIAVGVLKHKVLAGDFPLTVVIDGREETITAGEALDNPDRWHFAKTLDPCEPDYDGRRAVGRLNLMGSRPNCYSFAHGGTTYHLRRQPARIEIVRGRTHDVALEALRVMREAPDLYDFGGALAHVDRGRVWPLDKATAAFHLGGVTQFWRWHQPPQGAPVQVLEDPPARLVDMLLGMGEARRLKRLEAVITAPTIRPDGSVLDREGFDPTTGLLLEASDDLVAVPGTPTREAVGAALARLVKPFELFPLESEVDWAVLLAALLTAVVRPALPTAPAFAFDAPIQGSGKTLLASCVGALASGAAPMIWPHVAGRDDEEVRKRLTTMLRTGERALVWDNIVGTFDSAALAGALTAPVFADRILGRSEIVALPNRSIFLLTGNNIQLANDMPRRVLRCRINPHTDRPWARRFDLEPLAWTLAHRQAMASAALTIIRGWLTSGAEPAPGSVASFELWDRLVRQPVAWLSREVCPGQLADPLRAIEAGTAEDPEAESVGALLAGLRGLYGDAPFTARQIADIVRDYGDRHTGPTMTGPRREVAEALRDLAPRAETAKAVGRVLTYRRDRIVNGLVLRGSTLARNGATEWKVVRTDGETKCAA